MFRRPKPISIASAALTLLGLTACDPEPMTPMDAGTDAGADDAGAPATDAGVDAPMEPPDAGPPCDGPPGMYLDGTGCTVIAPGLRAYQPRYTLWADGADKERYIYLPPDTQIDTRDPDNWVYPTGTIIYKTFLQEGLRLETRTLEKTGTSAGFASWEMRVYAWNLDQNEVTEVTNSGLGERENVLGTDHDIPSGAECVRCHRSSLDAVNSFSAIMLNHDEGGLNLAQLISEGRLTDAPSLDEAVAPGSGEAQEALGYLHANCGHCHRRTVYDTGESCDAFGRCGTCIGPACATGLRTWIRVQDQLPSDTDTIVTAVGVQAINRIGGTCRIDPSSPETSVMTARMRNRDGDGTAQMPPITTEYVHEDGVQLVADFIAGLRGDRTQCTAP